MIQGVVLQNLTEMLINIYNKNKEDDGFLYVEYILMQSMG